MFLKMYFIYTRVSVSTTPIQILIIICHIGKGAIKDRVIESLHVWHYIASNAESNLTANTECVLRTMMTRDTRIEPSASGFLRNTIIDSGWLRCNKHVLQMSQKPAGSDESRALTLLCPQTECHPLRLWRRKSRHVFQLQKTGKGMPC